MKTYLLPVSQDAISYIERLVFETDARNNALLHLARKNEKGITSSEIFKYYEHEHMKSFTELELAKQELINTYIPKELLGHNYNYTIDFNDNCIKLDIICNCGIEILDKFLTQEG